MQILHRFTRRMQKATPKFKTRDQIRAALLMKGYSLHSFARAHGYRPSTVYAAAAGTRQGVVGSRIKRHLEEVAR